MVHAPGGGDKDRGDSQQLRRHTVTAKSAIQAIRDAIARPHQCGGAQIHCGNYADGESQQKHRLGQFDLIAKAKQAKRAEPRTPQPDHCQPGPRPHIKETLGIDLHQRLKVVLGPPTVSFGILYHIIRNSDHSMAGTGPHDRQYHPEPQVRK